MRLLLKNQLIQCYLFLYQIKHLSTSQWDIEKLQLKTLGARRQQLR